MKDSVKNEVFRMQRGLHAHRPIIKILDDPEQVTVLQSEIRREILDVLRNGVPLSDVDDAPRRYEMTVAEIANALNRSVTSLYHHIELLKKHGLIEVAKEEQKGKCTVTYYRRTAPIFIVSHMAVPCTLDVKNLKKGVKTIKNALNLRVDEEQEEKLMELMKKIHAIQKATITRIAQYFTGCVEEEHLVRNVLWFMTWLVLPDNPQFLEYRKQMLELLAEVGLDLSTVM